MADKVRQTQAERTASTRAALMDAAIEAIAELGYAGAGTAEISRRAGVSRGAQLHHFPTKLELVSGALDHAFAEAEADFRRRFDALAPEQRTQAGAVALLWEVHQTDAQLAIHDLLAAARTDRALRPLARHVLDQFEKAVGATFAEVLPDVAADPFLSSRVLLALAVLTSATVHQNLGLEDQAEELVSTLGALAEAFPVMAPDRADLLAPTHQEAPR